ncbi:hypothetical protein [Bergeyella zoohelcum]|uniref:Uncharacterized protein n=1 Tax=Bergeyella zoohelcum TaxID=1015 RepID=A0A380ZVW6_9FLAO|nr:hypothetical protein [Bergeyella zoohelcum]EKB58384.1 hypothetical protein HMPREF9700_01836 [Bergeyella zoohelcum CCUG 30536]SUV53155.1 Uncharacterised protein [Bergeyella zoohelcum]
MENENKVKLLISAEGDMNKPNDFKINLKAEGHKDKILSVMASILHGEDWLREIVEQALEMAYEE